MPLPLIFLFALIGFFSLFTKRYKLAKLSFGGAFILLLLFSSDPFAHYFAIPLEQRYTKIEDPQSYGIDHILVLGAGHDESAFRPLSSMPSDSAMKRLAEGILLHKQLPESQLILSGYQGRQKHSHATIQAKVARAFGVAKGSIMLQTKPRDTMEEALQYKKRFGDTPLFLVTSAVHMPRAMAIFEKAGLHPVAAPTDFLTTNSVRWYGFGGGNIQVVQQVWHEYLGLVWYKFRGYI